VPKALSEKSAAIAINFFVAVAHWPPDPNGAALSVGRPTWAKKIGCCPDRRIAIYRPEIPAVNILHFSISSFEKSTRRPTFFS
jgi:hypothetical protein